MPDSPTQETVEADALRKAAALFQRADTDPELRRCSIGDLLRYAIFSSLPDRLAHPAFGQRFELISKLESTKYLDDPIWMFDYAMLSYQVGRFRAGSEMFHRLHKGQRFFEVPRERSCLLAKSPDTTDPMRVFLRIISVGGVATKGLGRVQHPVQFPDPVPFSRRALESRSGFLRVGSMVACLIRLNPPGPFAEPPPAGVESET